MCSEGKRGMNSFINFLKKSLDSFSLKTRQWLWFIALWILGLFLAYVGTVPFRFLVYYLKK